jgi:hypothetical protein
VKQLDNHEASKNESKSAQLFFSTNVGKIFRTFQQSLVCPNFSRNTDSNEKKRNTQASFLLLQRKLQFALFFHASVYLDIYTWNLCLSTKIRFRKVFEVGNKSDKMWGMAKVSMNILHK